jgi:hypothetical protein
MDPVMTQPTEGDRRKMWDTEDGSMSLSCVQVSVPCAALGTCHTYGHLLLRDDYCTVLAPHAQ